MRDWNDMRGNEQGFLDQHERLRRESEARRAAQRAASRSGSPLTALRRRLAALLGR